MNTLKHSLLQTGFVIRSIYPEMMPQQRASSPTGFPDATHIYVRYQTDHDRFCGYISHGVPTPCVSKARWFPLRHIGLSIGRWSQEFLFNFNFHLEKQS